LHDCWQGNAILALHPIQANTLAMASVVEPRAKVEMRDQTLAVLGGALKQLHENGIFSVNYFGVRSNQDFFTLADLRYAVAFKRSRDAGVSPATTIDAFPADEEEAFQEVCKELIEQGMLTPTFSDYQQQEFRVRLVPAPFDANWQFVRQLGGGGQSRTLEVLHKSNGLRGVLKVLALTMHPDEDSAAKERFRREVTEMARIDHPSIARPLDPNLDESRGELGYITRLGTPLEEYWSQVTKGLFPAELYNRAYTLICGLAGGLTAVHNLGLVHRDLKPDNVVIIDDKPVIIDFGLVTNASYEAANLTDANGRQVANHFNPAVVYGLNDADARRDVAALGWLYGYLVGKPIGGKRRPQRFHWQFHNLVDEDRAERARSILAASSLREYIPKSAEDFCSLLDRLNLGGRLQPAPEINPTSRERVKQVHADNEAQDILRDALEKEQVAFAVQLFSNSLAGLRSKLKEYCVKSEGVPIQQYDDSRSLDQETEFLLNPAPNVPMDGIMREGYRRVAVSNGEATSSEQCFFYCHCGVKRRYKVSASLDYSITHREDALKFTLYLLCAPDFGDRRKWQDAAFTLHADGEIRNMDNGKVMNTEDIAALAQQWCYDEKYWSWLQTGG
jgi:serine/threonine protein kinase